jgi:hypothetical protein
MRRDRFTGRDDSPRQILRYDWQVQSQPSSQLSQQSFVQPQSGQPSQQSLLQQLAFSPVEAGEVLPKTNALANRVPTRASE